MRSNRLSRAPIYIVLLFAICLVTLAGSGMANYHNLGVLKEENDLMVLTWEFKRELKNTRLLIIELEDSLRAYFISNNSSYLEPWHADPEKLAANMAHLKQLVQDNPAQVNYVARLQTMYQLKMDVLQESIALYEKGGLPSAEINAKLDQGKEIMAAIRSLEADMQDEESASLDRQRNHFSVEYNGAMWAGILINVVAMLVLILFYRLIIANFSRQSVVEDQLKATNDNLESLVQTRTQQLSVLSHHLLCVSEDEKAKLARELHDELGSSLTAIGMDISSVREKLLRNEPALASQLQRAKQTLIETIDLKRRIMENLRPSMLDNLWLRASIRHHCEELARFSGLNCDLDIDEDFAGIDPARAIALFRITQEALNNTIKYAHATRVNISLRRQAAGLSLCILDDGIGISDEVLRKSKSHGLLGMRERTLLLGGRFSVRRGDGGHGCVIDVFLPFSADAESAS